MILYLVSKIAHFINKLQFHFLDQIWFQLTSFYCISNNIIDNNNKRSYSLKLDNVLKQIDYIKK